MTEPTDTNSRSEPSNIVAKDHLNTQESVEPRPVLGQESVSWAPVPEAFLQDQKGKMQNGVASHDAKTWMKKASSVLLMWIEKHKPFVLHKACAWFSRQLGIFPSFFGKSNNQLVWFWDQHRLQREVHWSKILIAYKWKFYAAESSSLFWHFLCWKLVRIFNYRAFFSPLIISVNASKESKFWCMTLPKSVTCWFQTAVIF